MTYNPMDSDHRRAWNAMHAITGPRTLLSEIVMGGEIPRNMYSDSLEDALYSLFYTAYLAGLKEGRGDIAAFMG